MNKFVSISAIFTILCLINFPCFSNSAPLDQEISEAYTASDYGTAVRLLEQQIEEQKEKLSKGERVEYFKLYKQYLLLAHIYAWRLGKPDVALLKYREFNERKKLCPQPSEFPTFEFLHIAEIHEARKDYARAREYYQHLLNELTNFAEKGNDDAWNLMVEELIKFVKYQMDGLHLKTRTEKGFKPQLLTRLKLSSQLTHHLIPLLVVFIVPGEEYVFSHDKPVDLVSRIQQSPSDLSSMILNYACILAASASTVDEVSEKAMEAYLKKYPESYYSLQLRYLFYKFYKESGENRKAEKLAKEVEKIASKRGIEVVIGLDKRFSSPEKTWETYRNALIAGDIDLALECYVPGQWQHKKVFTLLGKEKVKELGREMGEIEKIAAGENRAEYMIKRKQKGTEITYWIYFQNIDGEWKIQEF